jgi:hypothetical protein
MSSHPPQPVPVACTLTAAGAARQLDRWAALRPLCVRAERAPGHAVLWFDQSAERQLRAVARQEAACCQFLELSISRHGDLIRLGISARSARSAGAGPVIELLAAQASGT